MMCYGHDNINNDFILCEVVIFLTKVWSILFSVYNDKTIFLTNGTRGNGSNISFLSDFNATMLNNRFFHSQLSTIGRLEKICCYQGISVMSVLVLTLTI
jgi:hypothetical protein